MNWDIPPGIVDWDSITELPYNNTEIQKNILSILDTKKYNYYQRSTKSNNKDTIKTLSFKGNKDSFLDNCQRN